MRLSLIEIVPHLVNMHTKASPTKDGTELQPSLLLSPTQLTSASLFFPFKQNRSPDALFFLASLCISFLLTFFFFLCSFSYPFLPSVPFTPTYNFSFLPSFLPLPPLCRAAGESGISLTAGGESAPSLGPCWAKSVGVACLTEASVCLSL